MLEKLRQAAILTLLLNLLMALSSPATHTAPVSKWRENTVPIVSQPRPISPGRDS